MDGVDCKKKRTEKSQSARVENYFDGNGVDEGGDGVEGDVHQMVAQRVQPSEHVIEAKCKNSEGSVRFVRTRMV